MNPTKCSALIKIYKLHYEFACNIKAVIHMYRQIKDEFATFKLITKEHVFLFSKLYDPEVTFALEKTIPSIMENTMFLQCAQDGVNYSDQSEFTWLFGLPGFAHMYTLNADICPTTTNYLSTSPRLTKNDKIVLFNLIHTLNRFFHQGQHVVKQRCVRIVHTDGAVTYDTIDKTLDCAIMILGQ